MGGGGKQRGDGIRGGKWKGWWWELWTQHGWIEFGWPNILTIGGRRVFPKLRNSRNGNEEDHRSLRSLKTDDHIGPGTVPLAAPPRPFGEPGVTDKLQPLSRQGIRFFPSPRRWESSRHHRNFKSWRLAQGSHVIMIWSRDVKFIVHEPRGTLHLIPSFASPKGVFGHPNRTRDMESHTTRRAEEQRRQAEIRQQIALLQAQLADPSDSIAIPQPPRSPKRKAPESTTLAPATPSPSK